jgi:hypothetical protein
MVWGQEGFIKRWKEEYKPQMVLYNDDGEVFKSPNRFGVPQGTQF